MDNSQLVIFRSQMEAENQLIIYNSPIDITDQQLIVYQNPGAVNGNNGYYVVYKRDHYIINNPPNYQSQTKRSFLNECIRQLYVFNGLASKLQWVPGTALSTRDELWHQVNACLRPEKQSPMTASLQRVKRQLFRESRRTRKPAQPRRSQVWGGTMGCNFKPIRRMIGRHKMSRNYLKLARQLVLQQLLRENLKEQMLNTPEICQIIINAAEGIYSVEPSVVNRLTDGAKRMEAMFMRQQMRHTMENQKVILEESVRSIFYAKQLFRLIEYEEFRMRLE